MVKNKKLLDEEVSKEKQLLQKKQDIWRETKAKGYPEHSHCIVCGRAIHYGKKYCSLACKGEMEHAQKKKNKQNRWMCIIMSIMMPILMLIMFAFQGT
ncbi:MAG: DUF2116 family Zn-ribbon domain-containing protein [Promethearchaeota archaeon]